MISQINLDKKEYRWLKQLNTHDRDDKKRTRRWRWKGNDRNAEITTKWWIIIFEWQDLVRMRWWPKNKRLVDRKRLDLSLAPCLRVTVYCGCGCDCDCDYDCVYMHWRCKWLLLSCCCSRSFLFICLENVLFVNTCQRLYSCGCASWLCFLWLCFVTLFFILLFFISVSAL